MSLNLIYLYLKLSVDTGIRIQSNSNTISNNFIAESRSNGMLILGGDRNIIKGNTIVKTTGSGIIFSSFALSASDDNQVISNTIISSSLSGIVIAPGNRNVVRGNTIDRSGESGIKNSGSDNNKSEGNIIKDNSITNSDVGIGIVRRRFDMKTVVIGNTLAGNRINISDNTDDTVLADNILGIEVPPSPGPDPTCCITGPDDDACCDQGETCVNINTCGPRV